MLLIRKFTDYVFNLGTDAYSNVSTQFTAPSGEEITAMKLLKNISTATTNNDSRRIFIATWNPTTKVGKMYVYVVDPITGLFQGTPIITTYAGKILVMEKNQFNLKSV